MHNIPGLAFGIQYAHGMSYPPFSLRHKQYAKSPSYKMQRMGRRVCGHVMYIHYVDFFRNQLKGNFNLLSWFLSDYYFKIKLVFDMCVAPKTCQTMLGVNFHHIVSQLVGNGNGIDKSWSMGYVIYLSPSDFNVHNQHISWYILLLVCFT